MIYYAPVRPEKGGQAAPEPGRGEGGAPIFENRELETKENYNATR